MNNSRSPTGGEQENAPANRVVAAMKRCDNVARGTY